jgi:hypothetical protein
VVVEGFRNVVQNSLPVVKSCTSKKIPPIHAVYAFSESGNTLIKSVIRPSIVMMNYMNSKPKRCPRCPNFYAVLNEVLMDMRSNAYNEEVVSRGLGILVEKTMLVQRTMGHSYMVRNQDMEEILKAIQGHESVAVIQSCGIQLIGWLEVPNDNGMQADQIETILKGMRAFPADADVQRWACWALLFLALVEPAVGMQSVRCDDLMIHTGCIECISTALTSHKSNTQIQKAAIELLGTLARRKENVMQIATHGCIKLIPDAMHSLDDEAGIQEVGCK